MDAEPLRGPGTKDQPTIDALSREEIRERLRLSTRPDTARFELDRTDPLRALRRAAVLLTLYRHGGAWHLLFIRRAEHPRDRHSGEVGFPGGRWQVGDSSWAATALREAQEEIGLESAQVDLLGELRPLPTVSQYLVTPVIGSIPWPQTLRGCE